MKLMKHPLHGSHHAYGAHEEESMRANGWVDAEEVKKEPEVIPVKIDGRKTRYSRMK